MRIVANIIQFQLAWFACVLGAAHGYPALGAGAALVLTALHVALSGNARREASIVLLAAALGFTLDTALIQLGLLAFNAGNLVAGLSPYWMVALWMSFATTLNFSMAWLKRRLALATVLGAVAGPAAYYAGAKLGALEVAAPLVSALLGVAVAWGIAMPVLLMVANRIERTTGEPARHYVQSGG